VNVEPGRMRLRFGNTVRAADEARTVRMAFVKELPGARSARRLRPGPEMLRNGGSCCCGLWQRRETPARRGESSWRYASEARGTMGRTR